MKKLSASLFLSLGLLLSVFCSGQTKPEPPKSAASSTKFFDFFKFRNNNKERKKREEDSLIRKLEGSILPKVDSIYKAANPLSNLAVVEPAKNALPPVQVIGDAKSINKESTMAASLEKDTLPHTLAELANKLKPMLDDKKEIRKQEQMKSAGLAEIRRVGSGNVVVVDARAIKGAKDTVKRIDSLHLRRVMRVVGFHNLVRPANLWNYNFVVLSDLVLCNGMLNGKTGVLTNAVSWGSATPIIKDAKFRKKNVLIAISDSSGSDVKDFLNQVDAQDNCIESVYEILSERQLSGVVVDFRNLDKKYSRAFVRFVESLKNKDSSMLVYVVVPPLDREEAYDLVALKKYTDKFIVNFSEVYLPDKGPIYPISCKGTANLTQVISRYLNRDIPASQIIAGLTYNGAYWKVNHGALQSASYMPYANVVEQDGEAGYDESFPAAYVDISKNGDLTGRIWYDNDRSLSDKYDFFIQQNISGMAIMPLGLDGDYTELWDVLLLKAFTVDTATRYDTVRHAVAREMTFLENMFGSFEFYMKLLHDPSHLKPQDYPRPVYMGNLAAFLFVLVVILHVIYIYFLVNKGVTWKFKKTMKVILATNTSIFILIALAYMYLNDKIPFGVQQPGARTSFYVYVILMAIGVIAGMILYRFFKVAKEDRP